MLFREFVEEEDTLHEEVNASKARATALRKQADEEDAEFVGHGNAVRLIDAIRNCCNPPATFSSDNVRCFFVRDYTVDTSGVLTRVTGVIVEQFLTERQWHRPHPGSRPGVASIHSVPVTVAEVARTAVGLYADGVVCVGGLQTVRRASCRGSCNRDALLVCAHRVDYGSGTQTLEVSLLCPRCPRVDRVAEATVTDARTPHPAFRPKR